MTEQKKKPDPEKDPEKESKDTPEKETPEEDLKTDPPHEKEESKEPPEPTAKEEEKESLPPVDLMKSQRQLFSYWVNEINGIRMQLAQQTDQAIKMLGGELRRMLVESFAEELGLKIGPDGYTFNTKEMRFIEFVPPDQNKPPTPPPGSPPDPKGPPPGLQKPTPSEH